MGDHLVDIFDDNYKHIGVKMKSEAHQKGFWHRVFTCIFVNPKNNSVILQKKYSKRYSFERPDYVDITVGAHYEAGETIEQGIREISEEIGINVSVKDLVSLGVRQTASTISENYIANEFQHLFLYADDRSLTDYKIDNHEVSGLVEVSIDEGLKLLLGQMALVHAKHMYFCDDIKVVKDIELTTADFIPAYLNKDQLYLHLFIAAKRYLNGEEKAHLCW